MLFRSDAVEDAGDNGEDDVISVIKTAVGDHERDRMNQRQIDSVVQEVLPQLHYPQTEIGVIAPYNNQVDALKEAQEKATEAQPYKIVVKPSEEAYVMEKIPQNYAAWADRRIQYNTCKEDRSENNARL